MGGDFLYFETAKEIVEKILNISFDIQFFSQEKSNGNYLSAYTKDSIIYMNREWTMNVDEINVIHVMFHEARHIYQRFLVEGKRESKYISKKDIEQWAIEFSHYVLPENEEKQDNNYYSQSIEIDAIAFSNLLVLKMFDVKAEVLPEIKEKVEERTKEVYNEISYLFEK